MPLLKSRAYLERPNTCESSKYGLYDLGMLSLVERRKLPPIPVAVVVIPSNGDDLRVPESFPLLSKIGSHKMRMMSSYFA